MDILPILKAIGNKRRLMILNFLSREGSLSTKEMLNQMDKDIYVQYLYADLSVLRKSGLITREYSDEVRGFIYSLSHKIIEVDFKNETIIGRDK